MDGSVSGTDTGYRCYSGKVLRRKLTWESIPKLLVMNRSDTGNEGLSDCDINPLLIPIPVTAIVANALFAILVADFCNFYFFFSYVVEDSRVNVSVVAASPKGARGAIREF